MQQVFECVAVKFYFHSIWKLWQNLTKKLEKLVKFLFGANCCTVVTIKSMWFISRFSKQNMATSHHILRQKWGFDIFGLYVSGGPQTKAGIINFFLLSSLTCSQIWLSLPLYNSLMIHLPHKIGKKVLKPWSPDSRSLCTQSRLNSWAPHQAH